VGVEVLRRRPKGRRRREEEELLREVDGTCPAGARGGNTLYLA